MWENNVLGLLILLTSLGVKHESGMWKERKVNLSEVKELAFGPTAS